ncbi:MAG TPA: hypothetical protein VEV17_08860 [Bryobacteraceae bacterium]|nr:hypothetical protein [Bryobacteraceae bacterium]
MPATSMPVLAKRTCSRLYRPGRPTACEKLRESPPPRLFFDMQITIEANCPRCGSHDVRRSRRTGLLVAMLRPCLLDRYRCRSCFRSFFRPRTAAAQGAAISLARSAASGS